VKPVLRLTSEISKNPNEYVGRRLKLVYWTYRRGSQPSLLPIVCHQPTKLWLFGIIWPH